MLNKPNNPVHFRTGLFLSDKSQRATFHFLWTRKSVLQEADPIPEAEFRQLLANGGKTLNKEIEDNILELIRNYDKNRHVYVLKGWTTDNGSLSQKFMASKYKEPKPCRSF